MNVSEMISYTSPMSLRLIPSSYSENDCRDGFPRLKEHMHRYVFPICEKVCIRYEESHLIDQCKLRTFHNYEIYRQYFVDQATEGFVSFWVIYALSSIFIFFILHIGYFILTDSKLQQHPYRLFGVELIMCAGFLCTMNFA